MNLTLFLFSRGHGTFMDEARLKGTVSGIVERVDKLVTARPMKSR
eukprot:SAG11_NODE_2120_length_3790_cov_6.378759_5_plen_45_part_00